MDAQRLKNLHDQLSNMEFMAKKFGGDWIAKAQETREEIVLTKVISDKHVTMSDGMTARVIVVEEDVFDKNTKTNKNENEDDSVVAQGCETGEPISHVYVRPGAGLIQRNKNFSFGSVSVPRKRRRGNLMGFFSVVPLSCHERVRLFNLMMDKIVAESGWIPSRVPIGFDEGTKETLSMLGRSLTEACETLASGRMFAGLVQTAENLSGAAARTVEMGTDGLKSFVLFLVTVLGLGICAFADVIPAGVSAAFGLLLGFLQFGFPTQLFTSVKNHVQVLVDYVSMRERTELRRGDMIVSEGVFDTPADIVEAFVHLLYNGLSLGHLASIFGEHGRSTRSINQLRKIVQERERDRKGATEVARDILNIIQECLDMVGEYTGCHVNLVNTGTPEVDSLVEAMLAFQPTIYNQDTFVQLETLSRRCLLLKDKYRKVPRVDARLQVASLELDKVRAKFIQANLSGEMARKAPLSLLFAGKSQIGKSAAVPAIISAIMIRTLPKEQAEDFMKNSTKYIYSRTPESRFWDGYAFQPCVVLDEFGQSIDAPGHQENEYLDFIRMSNVFPFNLHMAKLETKGNSYFNSRLVVATSNRRTIECNSILDEEAVTNRFQYFYVAPKKNLCMNNADNPWERIPDKKKIDDEIDAFRALHGSTFCTSTYEFFLVDTREKINGGSQYKRVKKMTWDQMIDYCVRKYKSESDNHDGYINGLDAFRLREFDATHGSTQDGVVAQMAGSSSTDFHSATDFEEIDGFIDLSKYSEKVALPKWQENYFRLMHSIYGAEAAALIAECGSSHDAAFIFQMIPGYNVALFEPKALITQMRGLASDGTLSKLLKPRHHEVVNAQGQLVKVDVNGPVLKDPLSIRERMQSAARGIKDAVSDFYSDMKSYLDSNPMILHYGKIAAGVTIAAGAIAVFSWMACSKSDSSEEEEDVEQAAEVREQYGSDSAGSRQNEKQRHKTRKHQHKFRISQYVDDKADEEFFRGIEGFGGDDRNEYASRFGEAESVLDREVKFLEKHHMEGAVSDDNLSNTKVAWIMEAYKKLCASVLPATAFATIRGRLLADRMRNGVLSENADLKPSHKAKKSLAHYFGDQYDASESLVANVARIASLRDCPFRWSEDIPIPTRVSEKTKCSSCPNHCLVLSKSKTCFYCCGIKEAPVELFVPGNLSDIKAPSHEERNSESLGFQYNAKAIVNSHEVIDNNADAQNGAQDFAGMSAAVKLMRRNTYAFHIDGRRVGFAQFIAKRTFVFPGHFVVKMSIDVEAGKLTRDSPVQLVSDERCVDLNVGHLLDTTVYLKSYCSDICACVAPNVQEHGDIRGLFFEDDKLPGLEHFRVFFSKVSPAGNQCMIAQVSDGSFEFDKMTVNLQTSEGVVKYDVARRVKYRAMTTYGDCGSMVQLITTKPGPRFLGMHVAGHQRSDFGYAAVITRGMLDEAMQEFCPVAQGSLVVMEDLWRPQVFGLPRNGNFTPLYWSPYKVSCPVETKIIPSQLFGDWGESKYIPAKLRPFTHEGVRHDPYYNALGVYGGEVAKHVDPDVLDACVHDYFRVFSAATAGFPKKKVYGFRVAVEGIAGENFVNGIPRGTSQGYNAFKPGEKPNKMAYFGDGDEYDFSGEKCRELQLQVLQIIQDAKRGVRHEHIYVDFLKDERRKTAKALSGKTRMVSACPMPLLIATRMYFLAFIDALMSTRFENGVAIGANPTSSEWQTIAEKMSSKGDKVFAGDFTGFDGSEMPQIHVKICDLINDWYDDGPVNAQVRRTLFSEVFGSTHVGPGGAIYGFTHALPSGHPLTTPINSVYNHVAFRYCWYRAHGNKLSSIARFSEDCYLCAFGDDNILNITDDVAEKFNQLSCTEYMKELGLTYTSETKEEVPPPTRRLCDITFLKRSFRWDERVRQHVAPLELSVLKETPYWTKRGDRSEDITRDNVENVLRELSLHDQEAWDDYAPKLMKAALTKLNYVTKYKQRVAYFADVIAGDK